MKLSHPSPSLPGVCVGDVIGVEAKSNKRTEKNTKITVNRELTHEEQQREEKKLVLIKVFVYVAV